MIKKYTHTLLFFIIFLFYSQLTQAQNISGIVNTYAKVTNISSNVFTIGAFDGRPGNRIQDFNAGKRVMIYQAKGATINTSNSNLFGDINALGEAGKYEIATVVTRSGNDITFANLVNTYDVNSLVQLIYIPNNYNNANVVGTVHSLAWNSTNGYGGVVAIEANRLTLRANINVDGEGFTGGVASSNNGNSCVTIYRETNTIYAEKGEGITTYSSQTRGQGPLANGGGGGSTHNGGGGGGSNHGKGAQGGIGYNCSASTNAGGYGGTAMTYDNTGQRLFFGGGGGGAQQNNSLGTNGGNGGGIIMLLIKELTTNCSATHTISARGENSVDAGNDGAGGAGAGGVIYVHTQTYNPSTCNINLNVDGGNGGDVGSGAAHGGGGGGGSGLIYSSIAFPTGVNSSGSNGTDGDDNTGGSQSGDPGIDEPVDVIIEPEAPPGSYPVKGPGGHTSKLRMWLKADANNLFADPDLTTPINNGQEVKSWENEANSANYIDILGVNSQTTFLNSTSDQLNYNGIVHLNNTNRNLRSENSLIAQTLIVVTKSSVTTELDGLLGLDGDRGIRLSNNVNDWRSGGNNDWSNGGSAFINGESGNTHNQEWHIVYQEKGTAVTNNLFVGGYVSGRPYMGDIAEVISYEDQLTPQEQSRIESYLALKYGITLPNDNYVNSSYQAVWNHSGSYLAYHNDIAGLGRDDASDLNQTKSKSINSDAVLTIETESAFNDKQFIVWGNNDISLSSRNTTDIPIAWSERLNRIWRLRRIGTTNTTTLSFDLTALGITSPKEEDFALLIDNNLTFNNATEHTTGRSLNVSENSISFTGVSILNNQYFTLVTKKKPAPGGVANLEFWLKANAGTGSTANGGTVNPWEDQLDNNDAKKSGSIALPIYRTNQLNFNPIMDYSSATNQVYNISNSGDINTINNTLEKAFTIVFTTGSDIASRQVLYEEGGGARGVNAYIFNNELYIGAWNRVTSDGPGDDWGFSYEKIAIAVNTPYVMTFNMLGNNSLNGKLELISAGKIEKTNNVIGRLYSHAGKIGVGGMINGSYFEPSTNNESGNGYYFKGELAEITYAKEYLEAAKRNRLESYLAIKYGITLDQSTAQNYTASNGSVTWSGSTNSSYNNDIAGIAKDDNTGLEQLKSKSVNASSILTIANGTDINSPTNFSADNSFLIWGHNDGSNTTLTGDYLGKTDSGIARIWRVSEPNTVGNVRVSISNTDLPSAITTLLVSSDPSFPNTAATRTINLSTGATREATVDFAGGEYFTFSKLNNAPVLANMETSVINYCDGNEVLTSTLTLTDSDGDLQTAIITFDSGFQTGEDALVYSIGSGVTIVSQTPQRIEIQASVTNMQAALRQISYTNSQSGSSRTTANRVVSIIVNDGTEDSNQVIRTIKPSIVPQPVGIFFSN